MEGDQEGSGASRTNKTKEISIFFFIQTQVCLFTWSILPALGDLQEGNAGNMGLARAATRFQPVPAEKPVSPGVSAMPTNHQGTQHMYRSHWQLLHKETGRNASAFGDLAILTPI